MLRRDFLKLATVTVISPTFLKLKPEYRNIAYSENIVMVGSIPIEKFDVIVECNKPIRAVIEQSDCRFFSDAIEVVEKKITKRFIRLRYEWIGEPAKCTSYITNDGILDNSLVMDYERELNVL